MKFTYFICIVAFTNFSCTHEHNQSVPEEMQNYVGDFFRDARDHGKNIYLEDFNLDMSFGKLIESDGRCYFHQNKVLIDSFFWSYASPIRKKWLIYHELGHCILGRGHFSETFTYGECKSIMRENYDCSENLVAQNWKEYYLKELFQGKDDLPLWYHLDEMPADVYTANYENWDTLLIVDHLGLERTPDLNHRFKIDPTKDFQISMTYANKPISIVPKIRTEDFNISVYGRGTDITLRYDDSSQNSLHEIYSNKQETLTTDVVLKVKYKNGILFFFVNGKLVHATGYKFNKPIAIYNLNFRYDTPISIEAGNI